MPQDAFYNKNKIRITRSVLEVKGQRYLIRNISTFKPDKKGEKGGISTGFIWAILLSILIAYFTQQPIVAIIMVLAFFFVAVDPGSQPQPINDLKIILSPDNQEVTINPKDGDDLKALQSALEKAIDSTFHSRDITITSN
jgi:hypothetical protein